MSRHSRTRTRLDPKRRRESILDAAEQVLQGRDPAEVTFEEIADAAGVSRALVYNYFGDRGGLLAAVYLHHFEAVNEFLRVSTNPDDPPNDRIRATVEAYLDFAAAHPGAWRLLHVSRANDHPAVVEARERRMKELAETWGGGAEARIVACAVVGLLEAATVDWLRSRDGVTAHDLAGILFTLLWAGMPGLAPHGIVVGSQP